MTVDGSDLVVDYTGSSPQNRQGINVVLNYTTAYTTFGIKAAISPEVPNNEGSFRPVQVTAPEGCILNAVRPPRSPRGTSSAICMPDALFGALAQVTPDRVMAEGAAAIWITQTRGFDTEEPAVHVLPDVCGRNRSAPGQGRDRQRGLSRAAWPACLPRVIESLSPLVLHEREIRGDSGGPGRFRGGVGQSMRLGDPVEPAVDAVAALVDRIRFPPRGCQGGKRRGARQVLAVGRIPPGSRRSSRRSRPRSRC